MSQCCAKRPIISTTTATAAVRSLRARLRRRRTAKRKSCQPTSNARTLCAANGIAINVPALNVHSFAVLKDISLSKMAAAIHVSKTSQSAHSRRTSIATAIVVRRRRHVPHPAATARRNNSTPTRAVLALAVLNGIAQATAPLSFVRSFSVRKATNRSNKAVVIRV